MKSLHHRKLVAIFFTCVLFHDTANTDIKMTHIDACRGKYVITAASSQANFPSDCEKKIRPILNVNNM